MPEENRASTLFQTKRAVTLRQICLTSRGRPADLAPLAEEIGAQNGKEVDRTPPAGRQMAPALDGPVRYHRLRQLLGCRDLGAGKMAPLVSVRKDSE